MSLFQKLFTTHGFCVLLTLIPNLQSSFPEDEIRFIYWDIQNKGSVKVASGQFHRGFYFINLSYLSLTRTESLFLLFPLRYWQKENEFLWKKTKQTNQPRSTVLLINLRQVGLGRHYSVSVDMRTILKNMCKHQMM